MPELKDQVVLVTGCSSGIGRALAHALRRAGHRPFATARRKESIDELEAGGLEARRLDVADPDSIGDAVEWVVREAGRIDMVVNNAGLNLFGPLAELPVEDLRNLFETNVVGLFAVTRAVFPYMAEQGSGRIVNVGSVVGILPTPFAGAYCGSKAAVHMMSDVLRMEVAPFGIDVIVVQPGGVRSNISESGSRGLERYREPDSRYRNAWEGIVRRANASQDGPMETDAFAEGVVAEVMAEAPPRVVRLGTGADALPRMAGLPPEERDAMLSARFDLTKLP